MLGPEEKKHLAIAAMCGAAIGAVAGAIGYAAFNSTPSPSRRNSCASCIEGSSPKHLVAPPETRVSEHGDQNPALAPDAAKVLEELTRRMESLEQAVRTKILSRSGTNSSLGGYQTAPESPDGSDEEAFQDVSDDSSGIDDIFFHTSTTPKPPKASTTEGSSLRSQVPATSLQDGEAPTTSQQAPAIPDYVEIDRCLCSDLPDDNAKAHEDLTNSLNQNTSLESDPNFLWRFAKSVHQKNLSSTDAEAKKIHAFRAKELAFQALSCPGGEELADVHKWCAITIGNIGDYVSIQEKISNGSTFKERIDSAIRLNNKDEMSYYLLGRWCYSIYMMSWVERKVATSLVSDFPSATIDEALVAFQNSEGLKPGHWVDNQLYIAKCYIEKKDYGSAMSWLDKAISLNIKPEDVASKQEVEQLISKYSYYRKS